MGFRKWKSTEQCEKSAVLERIAASQLAAARTLAGLSLDAAGKRAGISANALRAIEWGRSRPKHETVVALVSVYEESGVEFGPDGWVRLKPGVQRQRQGGE